MLKRLLNRFKGLFKGSVKPEVGRSMPNVMLGTKVGSVTIWTQSQLDKHTNFKPGEQYRLGEGIVTVHANKESMLMAILRVEDKAFKKELNHHKLAVDIMMMSPEDLEKQQLDKWIAERNKVHRSIFYPIESIRRLIGYTRKESIKFEELPPKMKRLVEIDEMMKDTIKEKVKV